jgi:hypothetical protein
VGSVRDPDAVGRVPFIDLEETSARSPRFTSGLIDFRQSRARPA